ncbi:MAG: hypothetical protein K0S27_1427 [Gammaproteobacteria bacterium]|jgi:pyrroloquinoline quinone (PQQ) biosynthesis protein C|nr:hypothetical protein [Gammaproteobacteria bacterium]
MSIAAEVKNDNLLVSSVDSLEKFLEKWDEEYSNNILSFPIFDKEKTSKWTMAQRQYFVKTLYHVRGHFHDVLWYMGNFAPNKEMKNLILDNIKDEFNGDGLSHELLYLLFAKAVNVDLTDASFTEEAYLPFIKEFNQSHLKWLRKHDWNERLSFFAALERLDNTDYVRGKEIAESLGCKNKDLVFFNVHIHVEHFSRILNYLNKIWVATPEKVKTPFSFIKEHHTKMWKNLSDTIFNYTGLN